MNRGVTKKQYLELVPPTEEDARSSQMRILDALKEKGITIDDVNAEIAYRKETNAFSNQPQNEAFMNMTLNEVVRVKEMWDID